MSNNNTSTAQSWVDSATGAAQSILGAVTGNTVDQQRGADKRDEAQVKDDLSHATAKVPGGFTATASGVTKDDPQRQQGSWNQTIGSAKESVGGLLGADGLKQDGIEQNRVGKGQEAQGQLNDLSGGISDRVKGTVGGAVSSITGDREGQAHYQNMHDQGKTQQRGAEADIQRQNP